MNRRFVFDEHQNAASAGPPDGDVVHWFDRNPQDFTRAQRAHTTILMGGLTDTQDVLIGAALAGLGYRTQALPTPDNEALGFGKEFGNRGQCNPTYFTVGNLIKYLKAKVAAGLSPDEVVDNYVFATVGACGPCRFGTYATEYRKALRDSGFDGFRVLLLDNNGGLRQATGKTRGLVLDQRFIYALLKAVLIGDIVNVLAYRVRPYEVVAGATDQAVEASRAVIVEALANKRNTLVAMRRCRKLFDVVEIDPLRVKAKVSVIGEFWAMTTEGDGNYRLQRFLESEGAEVDGQMVLTWVLYQVWQNQWDTRRRMMLERPDYARMALKDGDARKKLVLLWFADKALRGLVKLYARAIGLRGYKLPDMDEMAELAHPFFDNHVRGGEGHMEVGKVIQTARHRKAHMTISIKPFGCMPSSGVSDGVQTQVAELYPEAVFCAVETTGDAAVMLHSRVQMHLFRAQTLARDEFDAALSASGLRADEAAQMVAARGWTRPSTMRNLHRVAGTAAATVTRIGRRQGGVLARFRALLGKLWGLMVDSRNTDRSKRSGLAGTVVRFGIFVFEKFAGSGVTPNQITLGGLLLVAGSCLAYWLVGDPFWLGAGLALAFTTDALDGAVARHQNKVSAFGGYLDAVTDRYQETLVYLTIGVVTGWWVPVFLTMSGSMLTSYNKARAAIEMPIRNKGWPDLLERPRRLWILCVALILDGFVPLPDWLGGSLLWLALVALAVLTHFTAVQRFFRVQRMFGAAESAPRDAG